MKIPHNSILQRQTTLLCLLPFCLFIVWVFTFVFMVWIILHTQRFVLNFLTKNFKVCNLKV